jgi:hypothetical protein
LPPRLTSSAEQVGATWSIRHRPLVGSRACQSADAIALDVTGASAQSIAYPYSIMYAKRTGKRGTSVQDAMT